MLLSSSPMDHGETTTKIPDVWTKYLNPKKAVSTKKTPFITSGHQGTISGCQEG